MAFEARSAPDILGESRFLTHRHRVDLTRRHAVRTRRSREMIRFFLAHATGEGRPSIMRLKVGPHGGESRDGGSPVLYNLTTTRPRRAKFGMSPIDINGALTVSFLLGQ
jgi:hypothetical protein